MHMLYTQTTLAQGIASVPVAGSPLTLKIYMQTYAPVAIVTAQLGLAAHAAHINQSIIPYGS